MRTLLSHVGRSLPSALRTVTIGSAFVDLNDDWEKLDERGRESARWMINVGAALIALLAFALASMTLFDIGGTSVVHVFARSEHVRYTPLKSDPPQWLIENATIRSSELNFDDLALDDLISLDGQTKTPAPVTKSFNGFFQPHCGDTIIVSRIGKGLLKVDVRSALAPVITDTEDRPVSAALFEMEDVGRNFTIILPDHDREDPQSPPPPGSTIWPLEGRIDPGRAIGPQTNSSQGVLIDGTVEVVAGRILDFTYAADEHELELGDQVLLPTARRLDALIDTLAQSRENGAKGDSTISTLCREFDESAGSDNTDKGFIHLDDEKGMNVALSSNSRHAEIVRYRTAPLRVENNWIKRLINDPVLSIGWAFLGALIYVYRRLIRWRVSSLARAQQTPES